MRTRSAPELGTLRPRMRTRLVPALSAGTLPPQVNPRRRHYAPLGAIHRIVLQVFALSRSEAGGVGCSIETGSDAGKVSLRASSSAFSWCLRSRSLRSEEHTS